LSIIDPLIPIMLRSYNGIEEESEASVPLVGTHDPEDAGSSSRVEIPHSDDSGPAHPADDGPEFNDPVRRDASVVPLETAPPDRESHDLQKPPQHLSDEGPSFKDQARDARPTAVVGAASQAVPTSHIALHFGGGPDYKDQARHHPRNDNKMMEISEVTAGDLDSTANPSNDLNVLPVLPVWSAPTLDAELVSAHLVAESVAPDPDHPVFLTAQVVDTNKERRGMVVRASMIIVGILIAVLVPTFLLTFRDSKSSSESTVTRPMTPSLLLTNTAAPSISAPTSAPSISLSPSATPTMRERYIPLGDPISTDLGDDQPFMASLSSNGTVVAVANNDTIQVYRQNVSSISGDVTWVPLGSAVPAEVEIADFYGKNFTMYLAPDALSLVVGISSFQNYAGRVDVYDYDRSSDRWVTRGEPFIGNSTDELGHDVALSTDGSTLAIAASNYSSGISYASVWSWNATTETWMFVGEINGLSGAPSLSIALSDPQGEYQGARIILGDPSDGIVGKVEVHECTLSGGCSLLHTRLEGPDYEDFFGYDVSISRNGNYIAIGSPGIPECFAICANAKVYEFGRGSESVWTLVGQEIMGSIGYGEKIKLSQDGVTLAVFYSGKQNQEPSWTQLYQYTDGVWAPVGAPIYADFLDMSYYGNVVATESNGEVILWECCCNRVKWRNCLAYSCFLRCQQQLWLTVSYSLLVLLDANSLEGMHTMY
jgi:hypothetical protein